MGEDGWPRQGLEPEDRQHLTVLQLAGLAHDLGHGPFSHVFEKELLPRLGLAPDIVRSWEHEEMSNRIFDFILEDEDNGIDLQDLAHLDDSHKDLIKRLMHGSTNPQRDYEPAPWLFDVVANKRNGIDVDKFDYLQRDSMMCGVPVTLDAKRLMTFSRLSPNRDRIVFKQSEYQSLAVGLLQTRAEMHRRVYTHQKIKSVEFMCCDALVLVAGPLGLREAVGPEADLQAYINLDDSLLKRVQLLVPEHYEKPADVLKAQALLRQLERRQLYKYVSEVTLGVDAQRRLAAAGKPSAEEIVGYQSTAATGVRLNPDEIIVCEITIDQGMKAQNPMTNVRFYQTTDPEGGDEPFAMPQQQVTSMLGTVYQDRIIRVYSKNPDPAVVKALKFAFAEWSRAVHNCQPPGTPWRQPQQQQHPPRAPPSADKLAQQMFNGVSSSSNGSAGDQQQQQHMGSGGRSRKRSLNSDMAAASQGSQGEEQQQQQSQFMNIYGGSGSQGSGRPGKMSRAGSSGLPGIAEEEDGA